MNDSVQEQIAGADISDQRAQGNVRTRIADKYTVDNDIAAALTMTTIELTTAFINKSRSEEELVNDTLDWLVQSYDLFHHYTGTVTEIDLEIYETAIATLKGSRDVETAELQFNYIKPLMQRIYKDLNWTSTQVPKINPFRKDNKQRLPADREVSQRGGSPAASKPEHKGS